MNKPEEFRENVPELLHNALNYQDHLQAQIVELKDYIVKLEMQIFEIRRVMELKNHGRKIRSAKK